MQPSSVQRNFQKMSGKKSGSVTPNTPDPKLSQKCDPLTKWAARAIFLFMTLATFSWLDTIKVKTLSLFPIKNILFSPRIC